MFWGEKEVRYRAIVIAEGIGGVWGVEKLLWDLQWVRKVIGAY